MAPKNRTEYSFLNTAAIIASRILIFFAGYLARIVFTRLLSQEYVGVSGLFLDLFNILSLSELGISTAISYALYKPIAEGDVEKQKSIMALYCRLYYGVAIIIGTIGLCVFPLLDVLLKGSGNVDNIELIYGLYLINAVLSYLFVYKKTLIDANQKMYISTVYYTLFMLIQYGVQIVVLVITRNFILYLLVHLLCTLGNNLSISYKANKMYPFLKEKKILSLSKDETQEIKKNIGAMFMHKTGSVAVKNTDSLLISSLVGVVGVACHTNYYLIIGSARQLLNQVFSGLAASIGNLGAEKEGEYLKKVFEASFFTGYWMFGIASICMFELISLFIKLSFGDQYIFETSIVFVLCLNFYLEGMRQSTIVFRDSLGLFWYDRYKSIIEALINLVVSIILGIKWGILGIFIGTCISTIAVPLWLEPYILYKYSIHQSVRIYFVRYIGYTLVILGIGMTTHWVCGFVTGNLMVQLLIKAVISLMVSNVLLWLVFHKTEEYKFMAEKIKNYCAK